MNFEFKSTFNRHDKIRKLSVFILLANTSISVIGLYLYLNNQIIPAVIFSLPFGNAYLIAAKILIALKISSTLLSVVYVMRQRIFPFICSCRILVQRLRIDTQWVGYRLRQWLLLRQIELLLRNK